ncbi:endonuclease/exonuclease/phosphatase family protein [Chryseobacterium oryctis]|uniref:Endonuclease/exonuclease/phosphatase family protein n=1 Tax=Chryseobacterium oryctis TaxID=2952618 RepID=A0ABT3HLS0_9FLAO|nr:endonuclease/exonuclease/phosphatase family protein [Chryseobacterium oryctis]MCW3160745.1 endonuclease/exonuclease/phosphatase family protein [Chryseobacterium oryctis]
MLLNAYVPPKVFPWFNLLSLAFPGLIIGHFLLSLFWVFSWKKRAIIFLVWSLAFVHPIKRWVNFSSESKEIPDLKIISLNVKGGGLGLKNIEEYINSKNADIVFLQEDADKEIEFNNLQKSKNVSIVSLYSKYNVINKKVLISGNYEDFNSYADLNDIEIKGNIYRFINVYLQPFKFEKQMVKLDGNSDEDKEKLKNVVKKLIPTFKIHQEQVEIIRKAIDESPYPIILAGDFNAVPNSYEYYHLGKDLNDAFVEAGSGSSTSFHDYKFPLRIDYIFASDLVRPISYQVDRTVEISDHFPVIATFSIKK